MSRNVPYWFYVIKFLYSRGKFWFTRFLENIPWFNIFFINSLGLEQSQGIPFSSRLTSCPFSVITHQCWIAIDFLVAVAQMRAPKLIFEIKILWISAITIETIWQIKLFLILRSNFGMSGKIQTSVSDDPNLWSITYGPTYGHFHAFFIIGWTKLLIEFKNTNNKQVILSKNQNSLF